MSGAASSDETRVTLDRWRNCYIVDAVAFARDTTIADVTHRIDHCVAEELPARCAHQLQHALRDVSAAVWRIRRLDLSFTVDLASPAVVDIAQSWSDRLTARVVEIVEYGAEIDGVVRFPDRAAYLAQFVLDLALGQAWGKWYYEEFQSLDKIPDGRAIAEVLTREPVHGMQTMLHLARSGSLEQILLVLADSDAQRIYEDCFVKPNGAGSSLLTEGNSETAFRQLVGKLSHMLTEVSRWSGRLLEVWNAEPARSPAVPQEDYQDALRWVTRAALRFPGAEREPAAFAALHGLLALRGVLAAIRSPLAADRLVRDLTQGKVSLEEAFVGARKEGAALPENGLSFLAHIARGDPDWAAQAAASLLRDKLSPGAAALAGESMLTSFGGIFLIAPALVELQLKEVAGAAAGEGEQSQDAAAILRHLVLAKCLGRPHAFAALSDPALRLLSGCYRASLQSGSCFLPAHLARGHAVFATNLAALSGCQARCLVAEAIPAPEHACTVLLLRDLDRNVWLYASALPHPVADQEQALLSGIHCVHEAIGNLPHVVLRGSLARFAESETLQAHVLSLIPFPGDEIGGVMNELSRIDCLPGAPPEEKIARWLASSDSEFAYFSFYDVWPGYDIHLDLLSTLLGRAALKNFARRLFGFQSASQEHLYRNFLEGVSTVHNRPQRIEVELPRSPLSLVLQLSGLGRQTYKVPWLEGTSVCLLPPRE
jgi:hypothetical protein